jgi:ubiquinone/menaquinone biosynthesis C-methylase UbiE
VDAPKVLYRFGWSGIALLTLAMLLAAFGGRAVGVRTAAAAAFGIGIVCVATALAMIASSRRGKLAMRDRVLDALALRGDERVLDVGCGRGLMMVGVAQRLTAGGRAVGVDDWARRDRRAAGREAARENARRAGVPDRVDLADGDLRALPFPDASFDLALSSLALRELPGREARAAAIGEMLRVVPPGGRTVIADIARTGEYVAALRTAGATSAVRSAPRLWTWPPVRIVLARR